MSGVFDLHGFDLIAAERELTEFKALLDGNLVLRERDQVLSSFKKWPNLCCLFGIFHLKIRTADRFRHEFTVAGFMRTDLTVSLGTTGCFCLVEFEGANDESIFKPFVPGTTRQGKKKRPRQIAEWAEAFEKGFSQIVDWAWAIDTHRQNPHMEETFGTARPNCVGLLVIGRSTSIAVKTAEDRWAWRSQNIGIGKWLVSLMTYDELYLQFDIELTMRRKDASNVT